MSPDKIIDLIQRKIIKISNKIYSTCTSEAEAFREIEKLNNDKQLLALFSKLSFFIVPSYVYESLFYGVSFKDSYKNNEIVDAILKGEAIRLVFEKKKANPDEYINDEERKLRTKEYDAFYSMFKRYSMTFNRINLDKSHSQGLIKQSIKNFSASTNSKMKHDAEFQKKQKQIEEEKKKKELADHLYTPTSEPPPVE